MGSDAKSTDMIEDRVSRLPANNHPQCILGLQPRPQGVYVFQYGGLWSRYKVEIQSRFDTSRFVKGLFN